MCWCWPLAWRRVVGLAAVILLAQGAGAAAYEDILQYGRALATDTLPEPGAPSGLVRWLTGNADPSGKLPWPFGSTNYLVWWGTGSWPLWLAAVPSLAYLLVRPRHVDAPSPGRGLDDRGGAAGRPARALLAALLPVAGTGHRPGRGHGAGGLRRCLDRTRRLASARAEVSESQRGVQPLTALILAAGDRRDRGDAGACLPPRSPAGADRPIQGWRAVGGPSRPGPRARPSQGGVDRSPPVRLGLAEPAPLLREARRRDAALLRRQPAPRPGRARPSADQAPDRRDHAGAPRPAPCPDLRRLRPVPRTPRLPPRAIPAVAAGSREERAGALGSSASITPRSRTSPRAIEPTRLRRPTAEAATWSSMASS